MSKKTQVTKRVKADRALELYKEGTKLDVLVDSLSGREWEKFLELLSGWFLSCTQ